MKKFILGIMLAGIFTHGLIYAQVKPYVGVVRQQYYSEYVDMFKNMSKELKDEGYNTYSKAIDAYLEGGFGSGFVWVAKDGTNYIVTNRHVVPNAQTASVEFEDETTGEITKYEGLKVVATNDDIDIAILAFKDGEKPFKKGLELSEAALTDGQEVWSAGFPGLGDEPVWQFGKGTVTNARARIKDLLDPEISTIIQHSAQVDSGNSGGPLLIASGKTYVVVGINTWKAAYRDSTNFAIPASQIKKMIESISASDAPTAQDRAFKLAQALGDSNQNFTSIVNFISYHKSSVDGLKDFESVLRFAPTSIRSQVAEVFNYNPAEGLRYACAYQFFKKFGSTEDKKYSYKTEVSQETDEKITITFTSGEEEDAKTFTTDWIKEHGLWRLDSQAIEETAQTTEETKQKKEKKSDGPISFLGINSDTALLVKAAFEWPLSDQDKTFGAEIQLFAGPCIGLGFGVYKLSANNKNQFGFQIEGVLRIPFDFNKFSIVPYVQVGPSFGGAGTFEPMINFFYEAGLGFAFETSSSLKPGFGAAYRGRKYKEFMEFNYDGTTSAVLFYVSFGF